MQRFLDPQILEKSVSCSGGVFGEFGVNGLWKIPNSSATSNWRNFRSSSFVTFSADSSGFPSRVAELLQPQILERSVSCSGGVFGEFGVNGLWKIPNSSVTSKWRNFRSSSFVTFSADSIGFPVRFFNY